MHEVVPGGVRPVAPVTILQNTPITEKFTFRALPKPGHIPEAHPFPKLWQQKFVKLEQYPNPVEI